ncbi:hypothetical protein SAMN05660420_01528 [Desulfuromusa kysingii]|uniref:Uncharacterized protein n=1 Tax=Desulfuromusa kysingii TaxID=37625 RepID=A0A1H3ZHU5_9BACT|nr:hypothetical protein [Desulfuromusa kysingii]SEA23138.1 hypothetical protein SAMN05660420_01528 [Desulfuromusa kysingii]
MKILVHYIFWGILGLTLLTPITVGQLQQQTSPLSDSTNNVITRQRIVAAVLDVSSEPLESENPTRFIAAKIQNPLLPAALTLAVRHSPEKLNQSAEAVGRQGFSRPPPILFQLSIIPTSVIGRFPWATQDHSHRIIMA